jgi:hypothetical protein
MQEKPKENAENCEVDPKRAEREDNWAADQEKRSYYYDDAHGYEEFTETDDEDETADID